jgi:hypothetical protein
MKAFFEYQLAAIFGFTISLTTVNQILQTVILVVSLSSSIYGAYLLIKKQKTK